MTARVGAVLLAAGGSTRMGRPKQLLPFRGRSLLRHAAETAVAAGLEPIVVVLGAAADRLGAELAGLPVRPCLCADWERGPGASVRAGVLALAGAEPVPDAAVLLLCDQPLLEPAVLLALVAAHAAGAPVAACSYADTLGVPALFDRSWFPRLLALGDGAGARRLLAEAGADCGVVAFPGGAVDLDTPEDYERLQTAEAARLARPELPTCLPPSP